MKYHHIVQFKFTPAGSRGKEMIERAVVTALAELSNENRRAMRPVSITIAAIGEETYLLLTAELVVSEYEQAIVTAIQHIEKTINPPSRL